MATVVMASAASAAHVSAEAVMAAVKKQYAKVRDYRVEAVLNVKGPSLSIHNMGMTVYYKKPNKVHVDAKSGMAMVPQGTFFGNPIEDLARGTQPVYMKSECKDGHDCHVIRLDSANGNPGVTVWVNKKLNLIVATETPGAYGVRTNWRYDKIDGKYYMPVEIRAQMPSNNPSKPDQRVKVTVRFTNYILNKGIRDSIFQEKPLKK
ncbi:outer membrane lipoprotein-sorting protein [bacterium]|nr:outer membrane lipoprotein-sorting protein [bacterium]